MTVHWETVPWMALWALGAVLWGWLAWHVDNHLAPYRDDDMGNDARYHRGSSVGESIWMAFVPIFLPFMPVGLVLRACQAAWLLRPEARRERARERLDELLMPNPEPEGVEAWTRRERAALGLDDTDAWIARVDRLLS